MEEQERISRFGTKMDREMIRGLYRMMQGTESMENLTGKLDKEIERMMHEGAEWPDWKSYEEQRDKYYQIELRSIEEGFIAGFKVAVRLIMEAIGGTDTVNEEP